MSQVSSHGVLIRLDYVTIDKSPRLCYLFRMDENKVKSNVQKLARAQKIENAHQLYVKMVEAGMKTGYRGVARWFHGEIPRYTENLIDLALILKVGLDDLVNVR